MNFQRYLLAFFAAAAVSANPMVGMAGGDSDHRNHTSANMDGEQQGKELMAEQNQEESEPKESIAQLPEEFKEPLASSYCFTETVIDESTGEVIALHEVCDEMADVA